MIKVEVPQFKNHIICLFFFYWCMKCAHGKIKTFREMDVRLMASIPNRLCSVFQRGFLKMSGIQYAYAFTLPGLKGIAPRAGMLQ